MSAQQTPGFAEKMTYPLSKAAVEAAAKSLCYTSSARCSSMSAEAWEDEAHRSVLMDAAEEALRAAIAVYVPSEAQREAAYLAGDNNERGAILAAIRTETDE